MKSSPAQASDKQTSRAVTVIIPTYRPDPKAFPELIRRLARQTQRPAAIRVVNTLENTPEGWKTGEIRTTQETEKYLQGLRTEQEQGCEKDPGACPSVALIAQLQSRYSFLTAEHIIPRDFDHAASRDRQAGQCETPLIVFMTQDAMPADRHLLENLCRPLAEDDTLACAYARQLPRKDADIMERFTRSFNYPGESRTKRREDLKELGIKTFFCSNVCAAYRRDLYLDRGGFEEPAIFNEDMVYAGKALLDGYGIRYCADARVIHSHNYSGIAQFHRNFDIGVSQEKYPELFQRQDTASESEGIRMVRRMAGHLIRKGQVLRIPGMIWISGCKYAGYFLGKRWRKLPEKLVLKCTGNRGYFQ